MENQQLVQLIFRVNQVLRQRTAFSSSFKKLSMLQLETLLFLKEHKNARMKEIASHLHITMPSVTSLVDTLVSIQLVSRQKEESDRRGVKLELTKSGMTLLKTAMEEKIKRVSTILDLISTQDKKHLVAILEQILVQLEKH